MSWGDGDYGGYEEVWGSDNVVFIDLKADCMALFTWQKSIRLYTYDLCTFLLCVNKKFTEVKVIHNQSHPKIS